MRKMTYWREAASVILVGQEHSSTASDSKILMMKRSEKLSFMPGVFVFPGGTLDESDHSANWKGYLEKFTGNSTATVAKSFQLIDPATRAPMFKVKRSWNVPAEIAFRICAVRELFEESGILLAASKDTFKSTERKSTGSVCSLDRPSLSKWRQRIREDDSHFLLMCQEMSIFPDIWALHEWACWLTPISVKVTEPPAKPKRFDTIFYICCLNNIPVTYQDNTEMIATKWLTAHDLVTGGLQLRYQIRMPQLLELGKLVDMSWREMVLHSYQRSLKGVEQWLPEFQVCNDVVCVFLPGDDLYPQVEDPEGLKDRERSLGLSYEEFRKKSRRVHRYERTSSGVKYICNIVLPFDYKVPKIPNSSTSQL